MENKHGLLLAGILLLSLIPLSAQEAAPPRAGSKKSRE